MFMLRPGLRLLSRWLPVVCWMLLIFSFSTNVGSPEHTSGRFKPFVRWLLPDISAQDLDFLHLLFRKTGHLVEYAILATLFWWALGAHRYVSNRQRSLRVFLFATFYAATDEFHQAFVPSRAASVVDVMIDAAGAGLALLTIAGLLALQKRRRDDECRTGQLHR
jgi:VanZ family protein